MKEDIKFINIKVKNLKRKKDFQLLDDFLIEEDDNMIFYFPIYKDIPENLYFEDDYVEDYYICSHYSYNLYISSTGKHPYTFAIKNKILN